MSMLNVNPALKIARWLSGRHRERHQYYRMEEC